LVAIEPQMYREVLAFHLRQQRPRSEVVLASAQTLLAEAERVRPHLIVANEVPPNLKEMCFWVEVRTDDRLVATISANGYSDTIHDVTLQDLLAVVDKTVEEFAHGA
jgi:DNA-binding IclR family transcriptional regulator